MTHQDQSLAAGAGASAQRYALPKTQVRIKSDRLQFSGTGAQYFRVWFVNVLLSMLTLGCVAVAMPFLWDSSKRFRIAATRWRGLRLRFGTEPDADRARHGSMPA